MIPIVLILASTLLWQEDFIDDAATLSQLYDYSVEIIHHDGEVKLKASPQFEGFASAWLHLNKDFYFNDKDVLTLRIKVNTNAVRLRLFFRKCERSLYHADEHIIHVDEEWQEIEISLRHATPFFGSEFPAALTPGKNPAMFLFIENAVPGDFDAELDWISINRRRMHEEDK